MQGVKAIAGFVVFFRNDIKDMISVYYSIPIVCTSISDAEIQGHLFEWWREFVVVVLG